jgi:hypothetical protein
MLRHRRRGAVDELGLDRDRPWEARRMLPEGLAIAPVRPFE